MDINEIQNKIMEFAKKRASSKNFELTPELFYIHLTEELGEVARQLSNKKIDRIYTTKKILKKK